MEVSVMDILAARDQRAATQKRLLERFGKPLICFTMNIAGPVKYSPTIMEGYQFGKRLLETRIRPVHFTETIANTGCEAFYVVDLPAAELKWICVMIEDSQPLCRLFDMDVLDTDGRKLGREDLGLPGRQCLLCDQPAHVCSSTRAHTVAQLQEETALLLNHVSQAAFIGSLAYQALVQEVITTPKPGLVDQSNNGSHKDMDLPLFLKSAKALRRYFYKAAKIGESDRSPAEMFTALRKIGLQADKAMLEATDGVNTHKGAIFTMGLLCGAAAKHRDAEELLAASGAMTKGIVAADFAGITKETARTAGERLYANYGITGIRGEAEKGFPALKHIGLPMLSKCLEKGLSLNDAGCVTLLHLMGATEDTNLIHRSDPKTAADIRQQVQDLLKENSMPQKAVLAELDRQFIEKNLSPGGSADLLAASYFLHFYG